jgi:hypothetical protein
MHYKPVSCRYNPFPERQSIFARGTREFRSKTSADNPVFARVVDGNTAASLQPCMIDEGGWESKLFGNASPICFCLEGMELRGIGDVAGGAIRRKVAN